jgi:hypothetical protein
LREFGVEIEAIAVGAFVVDFVGILPTDFESNLIDGIA